MLHRNDDRSNSPSHRWAARTVGLLFVAATLATLGSGSLHSADDKKPADPKDKKPSPLEDLGKKIKQQIEATAPPKWQPRTDLQGDPLPTGVLARLGTARFRHGASIPCVAYSPDGKWLATGGADNRIRLFEAATGKEVRHLGGHQASTFVLPLKPGLADFGAPVGRDGPITALAFAPDSKLLASGGWDDSIRLWDVATGRLVRRLVGHQSLVAAVAFSPDGKFLASRGGLDGVVRLWDAATGKELHAFENLARRSAALAFAPDSKSLAVGDLKTISVRDVHTGKETRSLAQPGGFCLAYSPDGKFLAAGGRDSTLRVWDLAAGQERCRCELPKKEPPLQIAFSPDGKQLAAAIKEIDGHIFDAATGKPLHRLNQYWPDAVAYAPDGKTLATAGEPAAVRLWDPATGKELLPEGQGHLAAVTHVAVSADGKRIVSGGDNLHVWDAATAKPLRRILVPRGYVEALALAPDGKTLATGGRDKMVRFWDVDTGKELGQYMHEGTLRSLAFSPDGKMLASGDLQLNIRLWDTAGQKELHKIKVQATFTDRLPLAFSPDGKMLACGGALNADWPRGIPSTDPYGLVAVLDKGYPVLLWDTATGKELGRLYGSPSRLRSIAYSADGKLLAAAGSDGRIVVWDTAGGKERLAITAHPENVDSSFRSSPSIAFTPDSQGLVSVSTDKTVRLWDIHTGKELGRLAVPSRCYAVAFGPNGQTVVSGQADTAVLVWDAAYLALARPQGKRNFSIGHIDLR